MIVSDLSIQASKLTGNDRALIQARYAAYTGIERIKIFLTTDPQWTDGSVAVGPVDNTSEVEKITIERGNDQTIMVTSTGKCRNIRKNAIAVIKIGTVSLISLYGGGIKQLNKTPLQFSGSSVVKSDVLVNSNLYIWGNAVIGLPGETRTVYANGDVYALKEKVIQGNVYAAGWVSPQAASGQTISNWMPPVQFPNIEELNTLINYSRGIALAIEKSTGRQHYFLNDKTFTESELKNAEGIYFVEGNAYIKGGTTNARASIIAANSIYINSSFTAENIVLIAGNSINLENSTSVSVALAIGDNIGWKNTGGGNTILTLKYGALIAGTINGGSVRGNAVLEQNDKINFNLLAAPVHTTQIISYSESE
ncbi:MAG: hypothetical protein ACPLSX_00350 [Arcobacter sp.]